jgi:hypothetical protein
MNKILKLLKGKTLKGLGKLSKVAWLFEIGNLDGDVISVAGVPKAFFLQTGEPVSDPFVEEQVVKPEKITPLRGKTEIE